MAPFALSRLAIPGVSFLISFLAYSSQYLFHHLDPGPLTKDESIKFNILVACIWICYARACTVDPGHIPKSWQPPHTNDSMKLDASTRQRWCRKCEALKPPRAHHCKTCKRCIPKMDHHCPWTSNCVSHFTFPHFFRFVFYAVVSMAYLEYFLCVRAEIIWNERYMPSYLGPTIWQLAHLFVLIMANSLTLFALSILLLRTVWSFAQNTTTIEGWEIERHKTLLRRSKVLGGYLDGPDGKRVRIRKQEFPYDIGIWKNLKQGFGGSGNTISWFWPFAATPIRSTGLDYEVNGFDDETLSWPPPDPDRIPRYIRPLDMDNASENRPPAQWSQSDIDAFRYRQQQDLQRHQGPAVQRRKPFYQRFTEEIPTDVNISDVEDQPGSADDSSGSSGGEEGWRNSEGERLRDFGVDEEAEFYDEDDIPLSEILRRRKLHHEI